MDKKKLVISTQMPDQFEKLKGFFADKVDLLNIPMIRIEPVEEDKSILNEIKRIAGYNWLIFTSMRGVQYFFRLYQKTSLPKDELKHIRIACIGDSTANELENYGFKANYINPGKTSVDFSTNLMKDVLLDTDRVLIPLGSLANDYLPKTLADFCQVTCLVVYNTIGIRSIDWNTLKIIDGETYDLLVFTSPSAFENFVGITGSHPQINNLKIASIGETTNEKIEDEGFKSLLIASKPNLEILAKEILNYFESE